MPEAGFAQRELDHIRGSFEPEFAWVVNDAPSRRNALAKPLAEATVAVVATAGAYLPPQERFDTDGDDTWREIPADTPAQSIRLCHGGYDTRRARGDVDVVFPLASLRTLADQGVIGSVAPRAWSWMGWAPYPAIRLVPDFAPAMASAMRDDGVDLAFLVPS